MNHLIRLGDMVRAAIISALTILYGGLMGVTYLTTTNAMEERMSVYVAAIVFVLILIQLLAVQKEELFASFFMATFIASGVQVLVTALMFPVMQPNQLPIFVGWVTSAGAIFVLSSAILVAFDVTFEILRMFLQKQNWRPMKS